jgi:hypothetical protein
VQRSIEAVPFDRLVMTAAAIRALMCEQRFSLKLLPVPTDWQLCSDSGQPLVAHRRPLLTLTDIRDPKSAASKRTFGSVLSAEGGSAAVGTHRKAAL